jgi:multicomponent K+:H+ antiporter subunit A
MWRFSGKRLFDAALQGIIAMARAVTDALENGSLQRYLMLLVLSALILGAWPFWGGPELTGPRPVTPVTNISVTAAFIMMAGAIGTVAWHRQRLTALIMLSVVGLIVALAFAGFSGPDLALTQLAVEVVTIVLLLLALYFLPQRTPVESSPGRRLRDGVLAGLAGLGIAALSWAILTRPYETISGYFLENSQPKGGGANVVNVILVDFRGFDTLGEITVLAIAALGIYAMLQGLRLRAPDGGVDGRPWSAEKHPLVMGIISRPMLSLTLLIAIYFFLRGHNLPGGGFIAGLVTSLGLILQYLASGIQWTQTRIRSSYENILALGLLFAVLTGLASWWFERPFLTSTFAHLHWPVVGEFELASAMAFDLGVFLAVAGVVMLILVNLGHLGELSRAAARQGGGQD